jgi:hypothetical protein
VNVLYIDANIFLGFYNSNRPEFKKLLNSIVEVKSKVFFTEQFKNEIDRNKLNIFKQSIDNYIKQISTTDIALPEHLGNNSSKLKYWNTSRKKLEQQVKDSNNELMRILNETLQNVSSSEDNVSKALSKLYIRSIQPSTDDLIRARYRKEIGNPPGKKNDPLGDQLSWEMLLNIVPKINNIWIISKDQDYYTESKDSLYLNPILKNDLIILNPEINIKVFNKLSEALRDFNNQELIASIPSKDDLDRISLSESYIDDIDNLDIQILSYLSQGYGTLEIKNILAFKNFSLSQIEKRLSKLKDCFKANNTIHLVSIVKDMGII